jgi:hypothetical protein
MESPGAAAAIQSEVDEIRRRHAARALTDDAPGDGGGRRGA